MSWVVNSSVSNGVFHYVVHMALLGMGLLIWMPVCNSLKKFHLGLPGQMVYLVATSILLTVPVPVWFSTFAENPIYEAHIGVFGIFPASDQLVAGLIMKIVDGFYMWTTIVVLFLKWSSQQECKGLRICSKVIVPNTFKGLAELRP